MLSPPCGPTLEEPDLVPRVDSAAVCSTVANTTEERPSLTSKGQNLPTTAGAVLLQELLNKGCTPSTLKVYVAAITANHYLVAG